MSVSVIAAVSLVASLASSAFSQYQGNKRGKQQRGELKNARNENKADMLQSTYRNSMNSPTAKGQVENARRNFESANNQKDNASVSGNMTHQQMLASKNATNSQMGNVVNNAVASQEARQQNKDERYIAREMALNKQAQAYKGAEAQNWANTAVGTSKAIANYIGTFDNPQANTTTPTETSTPTGTEMPDVNVQKGAESVYDFNQEVGDNGVEGLGNEIVASNTTTNVENAQPILKDGKPVDELAEANVANFGLNLNKNYYKPYSIEDYKGGKKQKYTFKPFGGV